MTDIEIKSYLPFLAKYCKSEYNDIRVDEVLLGALDLINQQQAEIEKLKIENQSLRGAANSYKLHYNEAKAEAVKEFAYRLQIRCIQQDGCLWSSDIGAELEEMLGEENEKS